MKLIKKIAVPFTFCIVISPAPPQHIILIMYIQNSKKNCKIVVIIRLETYFVALKYILVYESWNKIYFTFQKYVSLSFTFNNINLAFI